MNLTILFKFLIKKKLKYKKNGLAIIILITKSSFNTIGSVDQRVWVALGNSTHVGSSFDFEEAWYPPIDSPRVLDVPEALSIIGSVSSGQNCVVNVLGCLSTVFNSVNTSVVVFESCNNLEWNCNGSFSVKLFSHLLFITLGNVVASESDITNGNVLSEDTGSVLGSVWVSQVWFNTSNVSDVFEGVRWESSFTSVVVEISSTVNELLFREGHVSSLSQNVPMGFKSANCWEGPAWSALSLALNWRDHTFAWPIIRVGDCKGLFGKLEWIGCRAILRGH